ncbi:hypothetical protein [Bradyrhizobium sp. CCBAU 51765]|uniref:hypothetical protein n=1 Tax=Bradyrhizobium sp. CCBAU 51765 TaxID=1325102 RepID=UPI0018891744|nr:hypothetical protein [Bradyrhizobium sp. CCBAU 51765]
MTLANNEWTTSKCIGRSAAVALPGLGRRGIGKGQLRREKRARQDQRPHLAPAGGAFGQRDPVRLCHIDQAEVAWSKGELGRPELNSISPSVQSVTWQ